MKKASSVLYIIGIILNIIALLSVAITMICFCVVDTNTVPKDYSDIMTLQQWQEIVSLYKTVFIVVTIVFFVVLCVAIWAVRALKNNKVDNVPHILMIVIGVFGFSILYFLGGIFGLISENPNNSNNYKEN